MVLSRRRALQAISDTSVFLAYSTIVIGGFVRAMGAGFACPDWPLCQGKVVPDLSNAVVAIEYTHRAIALSLGAFVVITFLAALLWYRSERRLVRLSSLTLVVLVPQVALGALASTAARGPYVVSAHLALGTATFALTLLVAVAALGLPPGKATSDTHGDVV